MNDSNSPVLLIEQDQGVLTLTLNRPQSANALSPELTEALLGALTQAGDVRLCVIRGEGKHFCAGFDLSDLENLSDGDLLWRFLRIETMLQAVYHAPFPTVALAQGQVVGAGADLFAACWRRIAAPGAKFKLPGWNFELALGTRRLTRLVGEDAARDLLIDTRTLSTDEALSCGLASDIVNREGWPGIVGQIRQRAGTLPPAALQNMLELTTVESRNDDIAAIVRSAGRPGLKDRIIAYRKQLKASRKAGG